MKIKKRPSGAQQRKRAGKLGILLALPRDVVEQFRAAAVKENRSLANWLTTAGLARLEEAKRDQ